MKARTALYRTNLTDIPNQSQLLAIAIILVRVVVPTTLCKGSFGGSVEMKTTVSQPGERRKKSPRKGRKVSERSASFEAPFEHGHFLASATKMLLIVHTCYCGRCYCSLPYRNFPVWRRTDGTRPLMPSNWSPAVLPRCCMPTRAQGLVRQSFHRCTGSATTEHAEGQGALGVRGAGVLESGFRDRNGDPAGQ